MYWPSETHSRYAILPQTDNFIVAYYHVIKQVLVGLVKGPRSELEGMGADEGNNSLQ